MTAPSIKINGGSAGVKASVSAASAVTATLDDITGVRTVTWSIASTDETTAIGDYTLVQSGTVGQNVAFTSLTAGTAAILKAVVNGGQNLQTGLADATNTTATCKFYVPTSGALEVGAAGEKFESDSTYGSTGIINAGVRGSGPANWTDNAFLVDTASSISGLPNAVLARQLTATLAFSRRLGTPMSISREDGAAVDEDILSLDRSVTSNGNGANGQAGRLAWRLTDSAAAKTVAVRQRAEWVSATAPNQRAKWVLSVRAADGEHDYLTVGDDGNVLLQVPSGAERTLLCEGQAARLTIGAAQRSGTGANAGVPLVISGGQGQSVGGGTNNAGGDVTIRTGVPGTGGTGGAPGTLTLGVGTTDILYADDGGVVVTSGGTISFNVPGVFEVEAGGGMSLLSSGEPLTIGGDATFQAPAVLPKYTVAELTGGIPDPALYDGGVVIVTDDASNCFFAISDGTAWRRATNRTQTVA